MISSQSGAYFQYFLGRVSYDRQRLRLPVFHGYQNTMRDECEIEKKKGMLLRA